MKIEIRFTDEEAGRLLWLLRQRYRSKAKLAYLAKRAIREVVGQQARILLTELDKEINYDKYKSPVEEM